MSKIRHNNRLGLPACEADGLGHDCQYFTCSMCDGSSGDWVHRINHRLPVTSSSLSKRPLLIEGSWKLSHPVDETEDAKSRGFHKLQQLSTSWPNLAETKCAENRGFTRIHINRLGRRGSGVQIAPPRPKESRRSSRVQAAWKRAVDGLEDRT